MVAVCHAKECSRLGGKGQVDRGGRKGREFMPGPSSMRMRSRVRSRGQSLTREEPLCERRDEGDLDQQAEHRLARRQNRDDRTQCPKRPPLSACPAPPDRLHSLPRRHATTARDVRERSQPATNATAVEVAAKTANTLPIRSSSCGRGAPTGGVRSYKAWEFGAEVNSRQCLVANAPGVAFGLAPQ